MPLSELRDVHDEKNERNEIKLKDMSIDAVLDADSKYTFCWTVWLGPRGENREKKAKNSKKHHFGA